MKTKIRDFLSGKTVSGIAVPALTVVFICAMCVGCVCRFEKKTSGFVAVSKVKYSALTEDDKSSLNKLESLLPSFIRTAEAAAQDPARKNNFIELYGLAQRAVDNDYIYDADTANDVIKLPDGYLSRRHAKPIPSAENSRGDMTAFTDFLNTRNLPHIYIQLPSINDKYDSEIPRGVADYLNSDADEVVGMVRSLGWNVYDMRPELRDSGRAWSSFFFRTDHHWLPETALWASEKICRRLNADFGFDIDTDILSEDNFNKTVYKNQFLGSLGKRVGKYYAGVDDFTLIEPKFATDMEFDALRLRHAGEIHRSGTFSQALLFPENLERDYYNRNAYAVYTGGDYPLSVITNKNIPDGKILLIRDSFSLTLAPFMSLAACRELHIVDMRYGYFPGRLNDYIDKIKPDLVIMAYNANCPNLLLGKEY